MYWLIWLLAGFVLGVSLGVVGSLFLILRLTIPKLERLYIFRPSRDVLRTPADFSVPYEQCFIDTPDGARLSAWLIQPEKPVASVIYFHGNGGNLGILNEILAMLYRHNLQVLAVDYRGYGWSTGSPTEEGLYQDGLSTVEFFNENFRRSGLPLIYWGRSLGSCIAAKAASSHAPSGLILETAWPDKRSLLEHYPQLRLANFFAKCRLATAEYLQDHQFPVLLLHGDKDRTVPIKQGQLLYNKLTGPKEFWRVDGAGHIDIHMRNSDRYMERILQFVETVKPPLVN